MWQPVGPLRSRLGQLAGQGGAGDDHLDRGQSMALRSGLSKDGRMPRSGLGEEDQRVSAAPGATGTGGARRLSDKGSFRRKGSACQSPMLLIRLLWLFRNVACFLFLRLTLLAPNAETVLCCSDQNKEERRIEKNSVNTSALPAKIDDIPSVQLARVV